MLEGCKTNPALCLNNVGIFVADAVAPEAAVGTGVLAAGAVKVLGNTKEGAKDLAEGLHNAGMQVAEALTPGGVAGIIGVGKTAAEAAAAKIEVVAVNAVKDVQLSTGTVFDFIKGTQPVYPGSVIPKSFEMTLSNGQKVWVHGNATEHMAEYAASKAITHTPEAVRLASQEELRSFQSAVNTATKDDMPYGRRITVDGWQLEIKPPRAEGELPTIIHARYIGAH